ncbi:hypothetical protein A3D71_04660 [Candidatus Kaiserbacteria bacterium RIFCSPHIGHO2_02_FULL_55_20]|uniref:Uncharacterized protein n=1 Tax=Candidatus Kaiserbacteria bacterium RIFCSPHIGHO2_02_FULL_55_20 TaxID=1798497 RepID=A0A1F6DVT8_9BACT|nr:MAG: hypothetical protein A3D71_04660 [Candidatus Kaiserbacteria bacterium RIFCSPHIGHO2_02_FULL_55_20]
MQSSWKTLTVVIFACAAFAGGYYFLRSRESTLATVEAFMRAGQSAVPTVCVFPDSGSFTLAIQNLKVYVDGNNLRADWIQSESRQPTRRHIISNDAGGHYYAWNDQRQNGMIITKEEVQKANGLDFLTSSAGSCGPLWFADQSMFVVPDSVMFPTDSGNG